MILTLHNRLRILIYVGAIVVLVASAFDSGPTVGLSIKRLTIVETVLFALITIFDRYLWRWWKVPALLKTGPVLRGTWRGTLRPTDGSNRDITAYLSVRQTYSAVAFRLFTEESTSESSSALLTTRPDGLTISEYSFENVPRDSVRQQSQIHFGAARLESVGPRPSRLEGSYFTSRQTSGELVFDEYNPAIVHNFTDGRLLYDC